MNAAPTEPRRGNKRTRPLIAFFDYPDVFEDFYPHYGVSQQAFATTWEGSGNHAFLSVLQREVGDVIWYEFSLAPEIKEAVHERVGCRVKFLPSAWLHRQLWRAFYLPRPAWRWRAAYPAYAVLASYLSLASLPFLRALRQDRPDFFCLQDYASGRFDVLVLLAHMLGIPLIAYHSGSQSGQYVGQLAKYWSIPRADYLIASSEAERAMLARRYHVRTERMRVVLTPIDTRAYHPLERSEACAALGLEPQRRYLLFVGRLDDAVKRISLIIRTFAALAGKYQDVDLLIAGNGSDDAALRVLAAESAPGRARFLGWVSEPAAKTRLYSCAACLLLPSVREGFPTVVGEAMACGTPVLGSRVGGTGELVIDGETGWLFERDDVDTFAVKLEHVMAQPEVAAAMRPRARAMAEARIAPAQVAVALRDIFRIAGVGGTSAA